MATMFAHSAGVQYVIEYFDKLLADIKKQDFTLLDMLHHYSSGMKSVFTQDAVDNLIIIR